MHAWRVSDVLPWAWHAKHFVPRHETLEAERARVDAVGRESMAQLREIAEGKFSDAELATAVASCPGPLRSIDDSPAARLSFTADQFLRGFDETPDQRIHNLGALSRDEVASVAASIWLDVDYALLPEGAP